MTDTNRTDDPWAEIAGFKWLTPVRRRIEDMVASYEQAERDPTRAVRPEGLHMLLIAPPGLGRFRLPGAIAGMLRNRGHIRDLRVAHGFGTDLVSDWIGQTRQHTLERCGHGLNAMLTIQYASELAGHPFSREAVDTMMEFMDANTRRIVITMIFEPSEMPKFAALFPELVSRFHKIEFPIPPLNEQFDFLRELATRNNCRLPDNLEQLIRPWIERRMCEGRWEYMRQIGHLLGDAAYAWAERTGLPRDPDQRYQFPKGLALSLSDFEQAMTQKR
jgi:hypothetical protein